MRVFRARAPLRISFAGGGTDVSPYADERGGLVLNATVDKYAFATIKEPAIISETATNRASATTREPATPGESQEGSVTIRSLDYHTIARFDLDQPLVYDGQLDLVKAAIRGFTNLGLSGEQKERINRGFELLLHTDAPPGSGLGSSSALVVAIIGVFCQWLKIHLTSYEIASLAYQVERVDMGIKGGRQDQYAAAFGGFNWMEFRANPSGSASAIGGNDSGRRYREGRVIVTPLHIPSAVLNELHYSLMLFYTGGTRLSANIIDKQNEGFIRKRVEVVAAMDEVKRLAIETKNALLAGNLHQFGLLLDQSWQNKKLMAEAITNAHIDEIYAEARRLGALGGKISGAGGGGYMFLFCPYATQPAITERLEALGASQVGFSFEHEGMQSWESEYVA